MKKIAWFLIAVYVLNCGCGLKNTPSDDLNIAGTGTPVPADQVLSGSNEPSNEILVGTKRYIEDALSRQLWWRGEFAPVWGIQYCDDTTARVYLRDQNQNGFDVIALLSKPFGKDSRYQAYSLFFQNETYRSGYSYQFADYDTLKDEIEGKDCAQYIGETGLTVKAMKEALPIAFSDDEMIQIEAIKTEINSFLLSKEYFGAYSLYIAKNDEFTDFAQNSAFLAVISLEEGNVEGYKHTYDPATAEKGYEFFGSNLILSAYRIEIDSETNENNILEGNTVFMKENEGGGEVFFAKRIIEIGKEYKMRQEGFR